MSEAPVIGTEPLVSTLARKFAVDVRTAAGANITGTADATADTITTAAAHGLSNGTAVTFTAVVAPLTAGTTYYVRDATTNSLKVSATSTGGTPGTAVDLTAAGSVTFARSAQWTRVRGIGELTTTIDNNLEDDSDYDSGGWGSQTKTGMTWSLEMTVMRKKGTTSRAYDPGQEALRLASDKFGLDGSVTVRWYDREAGPEAYSGIGTVSYSPTGGSYTDLDAAEITVTGQGARTPITNPTAV